MTSEGAEEGWYTDPFDRHEARWMSAGQPTKLVRDRGVESFDEAPAEPPHHPPVRIEDPDATRAGDLRRADAAEASGPFDNVDTSVAAFDRFAESQTD